nr:uncharacterized protein LOC117844000 [Setaria viridis]
MASGRWSRKPSRPPRAVTPLKALLLPVLLLAFSSSSAAAAAMHNNNWAVLVCTSRFCWWGATHGKMILRVQSSLCEGKYAVEKGKRKPLDRKQWMNSLSMDMPYLAFSVFIRC